jgi:glutathione S-transferase
VRIVVSGLVPSPWSEATKGLFRIANVPVLAVRSTRGNPELPAWTGVDNVPVVMHGSEPARTSWAAITGLAARLAGDDVVLPADPHARAEAMGLIELIAGEDGLGWNGRLAMIDVSLTTGRGFSAPVAGYLAKRYGYTPDAGDARRRRVAAQLAVLRDHLADQQRRGHAYLGGARVSALDVYVATFVTPLTPLPESACPGLAPPLRAAFETAHEQLGDLLPPELVAHRAMILERHLGWPIVL